MGSKHQATADNFVANLKFLMDYHGMSQPALATKSGVSQKSISNILKGAQVPSIETAQRIADAFGLEGWHMILPDLPDDLRNSPVLTKLYRGYIKASPEGRKHIEMVAEREAAYSNHKANGG